MRRILMVGLLLLSPLLARADALDAVSYLLVGLAAIYGVVLLSVAITLWAYFRPASRTLQVFSVVLAALSFAVGLLWEVLFKDQTSAALFGFNPFLNLAFPLALWLGAARQAMRAAQLAARVVWTSVAVLGAQLLLGLLWQAALRAAVPTETLYSLYQQPWGQVLLWLAGLPVAVAVWWLVLEQVQRLQPLHLLRPGAQLWLLGLPALATAGGTLYSAVSVLLTVARYMQPLDLAKYLASTLMYGVLGWSVGVGAVWLNQRRHEGGA